MQGATGRNIVNDELSVVWTFVVDEVAVLSIDGDAHCLPAPP